MSSILAHGEPCKIDQDCPSGVCEMTYDDFGNPEGRKCLEKNSQYGKMCRKNTDCASGNCKEIFNSDGQLEVPPLGPRRCEAVDFKPVKKKWPYDQKGYLPDYKHISPDIVSKKLSDGKLGSVGEFIIQVTEKIMDIISLVIKTMINMFVGIVKSIVSTVLGGRTGNGPFGGIFFGLIHTKGRAGNGKCLKLYWFRTIITILFPPLGIFFTKGFYGFGKVILCSILTMFFYFPGLIYAYIVMNNSDLLVTENELGDNSIRIRNNNLKCN